MSRFDLHYNHIVSYDLLFKDHFINVMQLPKLHHIVLNSGLGLKALLPSNLWTVLLGLESISYRRPLITRAKKSIDQFKLRFNTPLGRKLTLRSSHSFFFFHRLVHYVLPRLEDSSFLSAINIPSLPLYEEKHSYFYLNSLIKNNNTCLYKRFSSSNNTSLYSSSPLSKYILKFLKNIRFTSHYSSFFLPFSKNYLTLPFSSSLLNFFFDHSYSYINYENINKKLSLKNSISSKFSFYSFSFGLNDFFTSFSTDFDKFHASYGLDITFIVRFPNNTTLSRPFHFLSFFQMPL